MRDQFVVRARGIRKVFGDVLALDGVNLDVAAGSVHGVVGPNGAGKTTLFGLLLGLSAPDAGSLEILGTPVGPGLAVPDGVAGFVDGPGLYPTLTARKNLLAVARLRGYADGPAEADEALQRVGLGAVADEPVRGFSLGMRQRLGLAAALLGSPRVLVLDEPANGLDPAGKRQVHGVITDLVRQGTAVILSSHRMDDLSALCHQVTLLATGRVVYSGPLSELAAQSGELDYRVVTSDRSRAVHLAADAPGIAVPPVESATGDPALIVRGTEEALEQYVARLVEARTGLREFAPVVPPLEAAFLSLTGGSGSDAAWEGSDEFATR